jgi:hypothetical protein
VSIFLKGTSRGTITDLDGKFWVDVPPGTYDIQVSYISYQTLVIEKVIIGEGEVRLLNNLKLRRAHWIFRRWSSQLKWYVPQRQLLIR